MNRPGTACDSGWIWIEALLEDGSFTPRFEWEQTLSHSGKVQVDSPDEARTKLIGVTPGYTEVTVTVSDADTGEYRDSETFALSVPQFVTVTAAPGFTEVLAELDLDHVRAAIVRRLRNVAERLLVSANVRLIWLLEPFGELPPPHVRTGGVAEDSDTTALLAGDPPEDGPVRTGFTWPRDGRVGPSVPNEAIEVYLGGFHLPSADVDSDDRTRAILDALGSVDFSDPRLLTLAADVYGRLLGTTLAHEVVHSLIGPGHNRPPVPGALMNEGFELTFLDETGIEVLDLSDFPDPGSYHDHGIDEIARPTPRTERAINEHFPVPPYFE